jgi:hypothetical protein
VNNNITSYCTTQGIQMQHIVPYTPQQNGVFERNNNTLKEMANRMIQSKGLSLNYWEYSINCVNYLVNHTPIKALKNIITPEEEWNKINAYVIHFHVFGSVAWDHIPDEKRKSLELKSEKFIFVDYSEDVKGYKILQPHSNEILLEEMLNLMRISWPLILTRCVCLLRPASHLRNLFLLLFLFWFLFLQMMMVRMKIHLRILTFL